MTVDPAVLLDHNYLLRMVGADGKALPDEVHATPQAALGRIDGDANVVTADVWYFDGGQQGAHVFTVTADGDMITDQELGKSEPVAAAD